MVIIRSPLPLSLARRLPSSLTSFTTRSPFAHFISTLKPPAPVPQEEEGVYASPVQSVSAWRKQAAAEKSAGIEAPVTVLVSLFECNVCGIQIGPGYNQQELFLLPVRDKVITMNKPIKYEAALLLCCGDCARHPRQLLPEWLRIVQPAFWETTVLLCDDPQQVRLANRRSLPEMGKIYTTIRAGVSDSQHDFLTLYFYQTVLNIGLSPTLFFKKPKDEQAIQQAQQTQPVGATTSGKTLAFSHSHRPRRHPLASYLSTLTPQYHHHQRSITL